MLVMTPRRPVKVRTEPWKGPRPLDIRARGRALGGRLAEPISTWWALWGVVTVFGAIQVAALLQPAAANPELPAPWYVAVPNYIVAYGILAAIGGMLIRQRWGMAVSLVCAGIGLALVVACPLSGHHHFGMWWAGELAVYGAWVGVSLAGLRSRAVPRA
jgi:hypothetical protein